MKKHPKDHKPIWRSADPFTYLAYSNGSPESVTYHAICCECGFFSTQVPSKEFMKFKDYHFPHSPKWFNNASQ